MPSIVYKGDPTSARMAYPKQGRPGYRFRGPGWAGWADGIKAIPINHTLYLAFLLLLTNNKI